MPPSPATKKRKSEDGIASKAHLLESKVPGKVLWSWWVDELLTFYNGPDIFPVLSPIDDNWNWIYNANSYQTHKLDLC